jgi:hypothetical protein
VNIRIPVLYEINLVLFPILNSIKFFFK